MCFLFSCHRKASFWFDTSETQPRNFECNLQFAARRRAFRRCLHFIALASLGGCKVGSALLGQPTSQSVTARASLPESASWKKASARNVASQWSEAVE